MKKSIFSFGALLAVAFLSATSINGQGYTYVAESFEASEWATAPNTGSNPIVVTSGTWNVAKGNIRTDISALTTIVPAIPAQDGTYGLLFATKTYGLITPSLDKGAGTLTYYAMSSGSVRNLTVETTTDNITWTIVENLTPATSKTWGLHSVVINDKNVKNIRFSTSSNGGSYIDNVLITEAPVQTAINSKSENGVSISSSVVENELTVTGNGTVEVVALSGSTILSTEISGSETINLSTLSTGFYVVKVQGEAFKIYKK